MSTASRALVLGYGTVAYACFLAVFLYVIGFLMGVAVPKTINDGVPGSGGLGVAIDVALLGLFAAQHTVMARPEFKRWLTGFMPAAAERSTFVLATSFVLALLFVGWQPFPETVWRVEGAAASALTAVCLLGWAIVLFSTFMIDHFELFGLRQVFAYARGKPFEPAQFYERFLYKHVRHPLMLGFLIAFWATPNMTRGHLLFAGVSTAYVLFALALEERTLIGLHGDAYRDYQRRVPKLVPRLRRR